MSYQDQDVLVEKLLQRDEQIQQLKWEIEELKAWKESAMKVWPDMQEIGRLIGVPLGQSVHDKIIPYLKKVNHSLLHQQGE